MSAISLENIEKASAQFWEQMLMMHLEPCGETWARRDQQRCMEPNHVAAYCDLSGVWVGRIEVRLTVGLAREATAAMLMQPVETVESADTLDATKEIANMIAGTLKSALPRPCSMTVPSALWESGEFCVLPCTKDTVTVFFQHEAGELMVRVWQQMEAAAAPAPHEELTALCA
ncbi:MAG TPA: chemotaxis protein CheX [Acidobacteriaceae bacterium]|nr:chemotaxis protein CheX [Acidobacteriaceae bacterium]